MNILYLVRHCFNSLDMISFRFWSLFKMTDLKSFTAQSMSLLPQGQFLLIIYVLLKGHACFFPYENSVENQPFKTIYNVAPLEIRFSPFPREYCQLFLFTFGDFSELILLKISSCHFFIFVAQISIWFCMIKLSIGLELEQEQVLDQVNMQWLRW